jgi:hypothetical protein
MPLSSRLPFLVRRGPRGCLDVVVVLPLALIAIYLIVHAVVYGGCHFAPSVLEWPSACI